MTRGGGGDDKVVRHKSDTAKRVRHEVATTPMRFSERYVKNTQVRSIKVTYISWIAQSEVTRY